MTAGRDHEFHEVIVQRRLQLAIDLDWDESIVEHLRDAGIEVALPVHDMAPVTGEIADREVQEPVLASRPRHRVPFPGLPRDRVVAVHGEIGRCVAREGIGRVRSRGDCTEQYREHERRAPGTFGQVSARRCSLQ